MGSYNDAYMFKLLQIMKRAGVTIVLNPLTNVVLQGRFDSYPKRRGMARAKELDAEGVNIACGHDCIMDPWYPIGTGSMLDAVHMLVHVGHMTGRDELFRAYETITMNPLSASGRGWGIAEGRPANFIVLDCDDEVEAIRLRPAPRWVVRGGRVVAETEAPRSRMLTPGFEGDIRFRREG
jgi:cytosine deaminase